LQALQALQENPPPRWWGERTRKPTVAARGRPRAPTRRPIPLNHPEANAIPPNLDIETWDFFGPWSLELGHFLIFRTPNSALREFVIRWRCAFARGDHDDVELDSQAAGDGRLADGGQRRVQGSF
jgi:hypothetical protein